MNTIEQIEDAMANVLLHPQYEETRKEYHRLLNIMGNVDGDEIISLVIIACTNTRIDLG